MIPLYVREGAIVPVGPKVQFAQEKRWDNLEIYFINISFVKRCFLKEMSKFNNSLKI
ncbi:hypothetical protein EYY60_16335 [Flavobacterium zhairuonense]|uniref:hypothetical protein n=1 Tax=Flavobacterium zhairuonense TaxID=2493631 RepID=UPI0013C2D67D|nr:hypothetical protein [Flavobacterium zhairuonense]KAF2508689.1 hypothetical protein EYY60_16335 [Flavobacterium zhairuonense]